jgi:hypothetical protein
MSPSGSLKASVNRGPEAAALTAVDGQAEGGVAVLHHIVSTWTKAFDP